jgi:hypothetical protein
MIKHEISVEAYKLPDERFIYSTVDGKVLVAGNATNYRNAWL